MAYQPPKTIFITGASKGLGQALALSYAATGVTLYLTARNEKALLETKQSCKELGANVQIFIADITSKNEMLTVCETILKHDVPDLIIANAGISAGTSGGCETPEQIYAIFQTNIMGVLYSVAPFIEPMRKRRSGQIVLISSMAGLRGMPSCPSYAASKNAVRAYAEGLRGDLVHDNVGVSAVLPGYIDTDMTKVNNFPMPFLMSAEKAASIIHKALTKNPARIAFPIRLYIPVWLLSAFPPRFTDWIFFRLPKK